MNKNEKEIIMAEIRHNLECIEEAINETRNSIDRRKFMGERTRLVKLLVEYERR